MALSKEDREKLRDRCKRDLFFLGRDILKKDLYEQPHREVCDFFVQKDSKIALKQLDSIKDRLLMFPRGSFKTTIDAIDCVQWILNYPDVRILILTAEKKLAYAICEEVRQYFTVIKDHPTDFQLLFPEFCVSAGKREPSNEFTTPARQTFRKEPTVWANSIGSTLPGWHCDVLKCDDVVNNINANEPEQIEKTISGFNYARKLVDPGGYIDTLGTPYDPNDLYAFLQKNTEGLKVLSRPAWTVKPESVSKSEGQRTADDFDLLFPEWLSYDFLRKERKKDPITFGSQYLIDPRTHSQAMFTEQLVRNAVLPWESIPTEVSYYAAWDLAYGQGITRDFTAGAVVVVDRQGRMYLVDVVHGRFAGNDLVFRIADVIRRHPLQLSAVEDSIGVRWLEPEIERACTRLGVQPRIHWLPVDRSKDAKITRISRLATLFTNHQLFISSACPELELVIESFANFTGSRNAHDDIPDVISFFPRFVPLNQGSQINAEANQRAWDELRRKEMLHLLYPIAPVVTEYEAPPEAINYF